MNFAIAIELVAAGDGAFRQCSTLLPIVPVQPESKTKSSTRLPSLSNACALTPVGPLLQNLIMGSLCEFCENGHYRMENTDLLTSLYLTSGINFCRSFTASG